VRGLVLGGLGAAIVNNDTLTELMAHGETLEFISRAAEPLIYESAGSEVGEALGEGWCPYAPHVGSATRYLHLYAPSIAWDLSSAREATWFAHPRLTNNRAELHTPSSRSTWYLAKVLQIYEASTLSVKQECTLRNATSERAFGGAQADRWTERIHHMHI